MKANTRPENIDFDVLKLNEWKIIDMILSIPHNEPFTTDLRISFSISIKEEIHLFEENQFSNNAGESKLPIYKTAFAEYKKHIEFMLNNTFRPYDKTKIQRLVKLFESKEELHTHMEKPQDNPKHVDLWLYDEWKESTYYKSLIGINLLKYIDSSIQDLTKKEDENKLVWEGKVSHLAHIFRELAEKGFIDAPRSKTGEINAVQYAKKLRTFFDYPSNNESTLTKYLQEKGNNIEDKNKSMFEIPHIKEVS